MIPKTASMPNQIVIIGPNNLADGSGTKLLHEERKAASDA